MKQLENTTEIAKELGETARIFMGEINSALKEDDGADRTGLLNYAYQILDTGLYLKSLISVDDLRTLLVELAEIAPKLISDKEMQIFNRIQIRITTALGSIENGSPIQ